MSIEVVELRVADLELRPVAVEPDAGFVYEHLKRYCSMFRPLPAILVALEGNRLIVVGRRRYFLIAKELGEERIRAVLQGVTFAELQKRGVPGLLCLVPTDVWERERDDPAPDWHVFFFEAVPDDHVVSEIEGRFRSFLRESLSRVLGPGADAGIVCGFDKAGPCFCIRFATPAWDRGWALAYHAFIVSISSELCRIATYQGRRFRF